MTLIKQADFFLISCFNLVITRGHIFSTRSSHSDFEAYNKWGIIPRRVFNKSTQRFTALVFSIILPWFKFVSWVVLMTIFSLPSLMIPIIFHFHNTPRFHVKKSEKRVGLFFCFATVIDFSCVWEIFCVNQYVYKISVSESV